MTKGTNQGGSASSFWTVIYVLGLLVFGALVTLVTKIQFTMYSIGLDDEERRFQKPWFGALVMFVAMSLILPLHYALEARRRKQEAAGHYVALAADSAQHVPPRGQRRQSSGDSVASREGRVRTTSEMSARTATMRRASPWEKFLFVSMPALFNLVATGLIYIGLSQLSASIWSMLRGSMIVFSAIESSIFLRRKLFPYHWIGVAICCLGILLVGMANIMSGGDEEAGTPVVGMLLVFAGQFFQATQFILEEKLLKGVQIPPMVLVGYEGIWGVSAMVLVMFPLLYILPGQDAGHCQENPFDTLEMLRNNPQIVKMVFVYLCSSASYNLTAMCVTGALTAVHRTMIEASRTAVVWVTDLTVHYFINPDATFGESWNIWSYLQLMGFLVLVAGQAIYGRMLELPILVSYPPPTPAELAVSEEMIYSPSSLLHLTPGLPVEPPSSLLHMTPGLPRWPELESEDDDGNGLLEDGLSEVDKKGFQLKVEEG